MRSRTPGEVQFLVLLAEKLPGSSIDRRGCGRTNSAPATFKLQQNEVGMSASFLMVSFLSYPTWNEWFRAACDRTDQARPTLCAVSKQAGLV
jgi:hypothetical protein